jgi:hypothetical protein
VKSYPRPRRVMEGGKGFAFGSICLLVCMSVCLSVRAHNSNTINPIDLKLLHKEWSACGSVLLKFGLDPDPDSIIFKRYHIRDKGLYSPIVWFVQTLRAARHTVLKHAL